MPNPWTDRDDPDPTEAEFDAALAAGEPVQVVGPTIPVAAEPVGDGRGWSRDLVDGFAESTAEVARLQAELARVTAELAEHQQLFELQWRRMGEATKLWQAEAPEERALIWPDLGTLLTWLIERAARWESAAARQLAAHEKAAAWLAEAEAELARLRDAAAGTDDLIEQATDDPREANHD